MRGAYMQLGGYPEALLMHLNGFGCDVCLKRVKELNSKLWEEIGERTGRLDNRAKWEETIKAIAEHVISGLRDGKRFSDFLKLNYADLYESMLADGTLAEKKRRLD
jgi:hypothetical protein